MKNITELREQLRDMQDELKRLTNAAMMAADDKNATAEDLDKHRNAVKAQKARIEMVRDAIADMEGAQQKKAPVENKTLKDMRASNEYHRAFAESMKGTTIQSIKEMPDNVRRRVLDNMSPMN